MSADEEAYYPMFLNGVKYANKASLQKVDICLPRPTTRHDLSKLWVIYVHGGAWRDPTIFSKSFDQALHLLLDHPVTDCIAGFASINYRLSPYPSHATCPSSPDDDSRNAQHSDHIEDVLTALAFLQDEYGFVERYLLVGHSCGATLAFQVTMAKWHAQGSAHFTMPQGVMGLEGIYDFVALRNSHKDIPVYQEILNNAFGGEENWYSASPTSADFSKSWTNGKLAVLAHSINDELVDQEQLDRMAARLKDCTGSGRRDLILSLKGKHDDIWHQGWELAQSIVTALQHLMSGNS